MAERLTQPPIRRRLAELLVLIALVALAVGLRWRWVHESLWIDELHTAWVVRGSWSEMIERSRAGNQLPAYFALVKLVADGRAAGGEQGTGQVEPIGEVALRSISLAAGTALVAAVFLATRAWTGSFLLATMAGVLAVFDRNLVFYSVEARPYALVQLVAFWQLALFSRLLVHSRLALRIAWVLGNWLLFLLHPTSGMLAAAACAAYVAAYAPRRPSGPGYAVRALALDIALSLAVVVPTWSYVQFVYSRRENWEQFVRNPSLGDLLVLWPLAWYVLLPCIVVGVWGIYDRLRSGDRSDSQDGRSVEALITSASWVVVPLVVAFLASATDVARLFSRRYLAGSNAALVAMPALVLSHARIGWRRCAVVVVVGAAIVWQTGPWPDWPARVQEDWRGLVGELDRQCAERPGPVAVRAGLIEAAEGTASSPALQRYLLYPLQSAYPTRVPESMQFPLGNETDARLPESDIRLARVHRRQYLVLRARPAQAQVLVERIAEQFRGEGFVIRQQRVWAFGANLNLVRWELALEPPANSSASFASPRCSFSSPQRHERRRECLA